MNLSVFCAFFVLAVSAAAPAEKSFVEIPRADDHNIVRCDPDGQDTWKILDSDTVSATGKFLQIVERTLTYPTNGVGKEIITCIRVLDLMSNGQGGYPEILHGGKGFHDVTIRFVSQRSKGFKFSVEIWGKVPPPPV